MGVNAGTFVRSDPRPGSISYSCDSLARSCNTFRQIGCKIEKLRFLASATSLYKSLCRPFVRLLCNFFYNSAVTSRDVARHRKT